MKTLLRLLSLFALFSLPLSAAEPEEEVFSQAELDQMLAPIALYPDSLLAQILTAATYPLEVVEAARWSKANPELEGAAAVDAVDERDWDPSVKALVAFPDVLKRMDEDLDWTRRLGDAVLVQEEELMSSVQGLRQKAYAAGSLDSLDNVSVRREREVIYIEPAEPRVVYVPYYRPAVVYGSWWWPSHPPVYWGPPATIHYRSGGTRIIWTTGVHISSGFFFSRPDWHRRHIVIHHHHHAPSVRFQASKRDWSRYSDGDRWRHEPRHRRGVSYRSRDLSEKFGRTTAPRSVERSDSERRSIRFAPHPAGRESRLREALSRRDRVDSSARAFNRPSPGDTFRTRGATVPASPREKSREATVSSRGERPSTVRSSASSGVDRTRIRASEDRRTSIAERLSRERASTATFRSSRATPSSDSRVRSSNAPSDANAAAARRSIEETRSREPSRSREVRPTAPQRQERAAPQVRERTPSRDSQVSSSRSSGERELRTRSLRSRSDSTASASSARRAASRRVRD